MRKKSLLGFILAVFGFAALGAVLGSCAMNAADEKPTYTVIFHNVEGREPDLTYSQTFEYDELKALKAASTMAFTSPNGETVIVGWAYKDTPANEKDFSDKEAISKKSTGDSVDLYARWGYNVTFHTNSAESPDFIDPQIAGALIKFPATDTVKKNGFTLAGWYDIKALSGTPYSLTNTVTADITLWAKWSNNSTCIVTYETNGGSGIDPTPVPKGEKLTQPADPTKQDFTFGGWYGDSECINKYEFSSLVTEDKTLYAKWVCLVQFDTGGGAPKPQDQPVEINGYATKPSPDPALADYQFGGWYQEGLQNPFVFGSSGTKVIKNTTIYAKWNGNTYTVTFDGNSGTPATQTKVVTRPATTVGAANMPANPTRTDYTFAGWFTAQTGGTQFTGTTPVNGNITVYAQWTNIKYTVTFNGNGGSPPTQTYDVVRPATTVGANMPVNPSRTDYTFTGWFTDQTGGTQFTGTTPVNSAITVYAQWLPNLTGTVTITGEKWVGGTLTANTTGNLDGSGSNYEWKWGTVQLQTGTSKTYKIVDKNAIQQITVTVTRVGYSPVGGVVSDPFEIPNRIGIYNVDDLNAVRNALNRNYIIADSVTSITIPNNSWVPIGPWGAGNFTGQFDGNGKTIAFGTQTVAFNDASYANYQYPFFGLFNTIYNGGEVKNLKLTGTVTINCSFAVTRRVFDVGTVSRYVENGIIRNVSSSVAISINDPTNNAMPKLGGITANLYGANGIIENCYSSGQVYLNGGGSGSNYIGGIVGYVGNGSVKNCWASGNVYSNSQALLGGIVGYVCNATILNCVSLHNTIYGFTSGVYSEYIGRIAGWDDAGYVTNCYANSGMTVNATTTVNPTPPYANDGIAISMGTTQSSGWWTGTANWTTTDVWGGTGEDKPWKWGSTKPMLWFETTVNQ